MAGRVTIAELLAAFAAAITSAFDGSDWAVWPQPPDQTAVPAVWPELSNGNGGASNRADATTSVRVVAAIAAQVSAAEYSRIGDAIDRCLSILSSAVGAAFRGRSWVVGTVQIGGVDHTAVLFTYTVDHPLPC